MGPFWNRNHQLAHRNRDCDQRVHHVEEVAKRTEKEMNKDQTLGIVRHILTFGGGFVVAKGYGDPQLVTELVGGLVSIIGALWSIRSKR